MIYAGIGSRETPHLILNKMTDIAVKYSSLGYLLRSGGAIGADTAFENGSSFSEIFRAKDATKDAILMAESFHPAWHRCSEYAKKLHGRNMMILLGKNLDTPVDFVVCWTKDGKPSGGTGQALRAALHYKIPVFNLKNSLEVPEIT